MANNVAVDGCELEVVAPGTGDIEVEAGQVSDTELAGGKGIHFKEIKFKVSNSNGGGPVTNGDGKGEGSIIASGSNILNAAGDKAVLEGDQSATVEIKGHAGQSSAVGAVIVRVKSAGQDVVIAL
jgi:hypothetical protein